MFLLVLLLVFLLLLLLLLIVFLFRPSLALDTALFSNTSSVSSVSANVADKKSNALGVWGHASNDTTIVLDVSVTVTDN